MCLQPFIEVRDGRHPCLSHTVSGADFIPNDIVIGLDDVSLFQSVLSCESTVHDCQELTELQETDFLGISLPYLTCGVG